MTNTISRRIFDFIKDYPPFHFLDEALLHRLAEKAIVQYRQEGDIVFKTGETPPQVIYIVREGAVSLIKEEDGKEIVMEHCDEGDVFGIRPLLASDDYALSARVEEETLLYAFQIDGLREELAANNQLGFYLATNMAAGIRKRMQPDLRGNLRTKTDAADHFQLLELQSIDRSKKPVTCTQDQVRERSGGSHDRGECRLYHRRERPTASNRHYYG